MIITQTPLRIGLVGLLVLLGLSLLFGRDLITPLLGGTEVGAPAQSSPEEEELVQFVSFVLDDAQFARLLDASDNDLWDWVSARSEPPDAELAGLVRRLRAVRCTT